MRRNDSSAQAPLLPESHALSGQQPAKLPLVTLGALGVVFGDIGTSPLYAVQQCFTDEPSFAKDPALILGVLSLILWSIILVVCVKYVGFILKADHDGEGGTLALLGLIRSKTGKMPYAGPGALTLLVLFGSALLYGDGVVTPAISVLSAVEGLKLADPVFERFVVPLAVGILLALFIAAALRNREGRPVFRPRDAALVRRDRRPRASSQRCRTPPCWPPSTRWPGFGC